MDLGRREEGWWLVKVCLLVGLPTVFVVVGRGMGLALMRASKL